MVDWEEGGWLQPLWCKLDVYFQKEAKNGDCLCVTDWKRLGTLAQLFSASILMGYCLAAKLVTIPEKSSHKGH